MRDHILRACPGDCGAEGLLREFDASPRPAKRRRTAEPTEPVEPVAQASEALVARRRVVGQPSSPFAGVVYHTT